MALNARNLPSNGNSKFPKQPALEAGTYPARLVQIITLGLQKQRPYNGEEKDPQNELYLTYEMLDEFMADDDGNDIEDKPRWLSESFPFHSLDADLAKSTKRYYSLDPKEEHKGDWSELAGTPCNLVIVQNPSKKAGDDTIYNNVASISAMRSKDADKAPKLVNEPKIFDIDEPDMKIFSSLPKWLQDKMKENLNYGGSALEEAVHSYKGDTGEESKDSGKGSEKEVDNSEDKDPEDGKDW